MARISVVIPTFNAREHIDDFIRMLESQSLKEWEAIFVDDCSIDDTYSMLALHAKNDSRLKVFSTQSNSGGPYLPRQIGIDESKCPIICLIDIDDRISDNYLEVMVRDCGEKRLDILFPDMLIGDQSLTEENYWKESVGRDVVHATLYKWKIGCNGGVYRKKLLREVYSVLIPELCQKYFCPIIESTPELKYFFRFSNGVPFPAYIDEVGTRLLISLADRVGFCREARYYYVPNSMSISNPNSIRSIRFILNDYILGKWIPMVFTSDRERTGVYRQQFSNIIDKIKLLNRLQSHVDKEEFMKYDSLLRTMFNMIERHKIRKFVGKPLFLLTSLGYSMTKRLIWLHGEHGWRRASAEI